MSGNEFKQFWEILQGLYPFDFKGEGQMRLWAKHMQSAPYREAVTAVRRWKHENELVRMSVVPDPEDIAKSAKHYCGYSKLFFEAVRRNARG